jgi:hypothetical protein
MMKLRSSVMSKPVLQKYKCPNPWTSDAKAVLAPVRVVTWTKIDGPAAFTKYKNATQLSNSSS